MQVKIVKHKIYFNFDLADFAHHNIVKVMQELVFKQHVQKPHDGLYTVSQKGCQPSNSWRSQPIFKILSYR